MKKLFTLALLATISFTAITCTDRNEDIVATDTFPKMRDVTGTLNSANQYTITQGINIADTDVVLVYRNINSNSNLSAVWQLLPKTEFLGSGRELDYNFLFDAQNVEIYTEANFDQATMTPAENGKYLTNQRFRVVLVPASSTKTTPVNYEDYNSVIRYYNIPDKD